LSIAATGGEMDHISYKFQLYDDNNDVRVVTNTTEISKSLGEHVHLGIAYLADGITGASRKDDRGDIDGITAASVTRESRQEVTGALSGTFDLTRVFKRESEALNPTTIGITGINSVETDYRSRTLGASFSQDLFQRNTTLGFSFIKSFDDLDPAPRFINSTLLQDVGWNYFGEGKRQTDKINVSLTQGITVTTVAAFIWGYVYDRGYLAKPYYVYEIDNVYKHEKLPAERRNMTFTGRINQYIPTKYGLALHCDYRLFYDSWDLVSHTASLKIYYRFAEKFIIEPSYRYYTQTSAFFYEDEYTGDPVYLTTDLKYRECMSNTFGLKLIYELKDFFKPEDAPVLSLFPVTIDIAGNYLLRTGPDDPAVLDAHYARWSGQFSTFWIQAGVVFAF
jgi:hypothetical protein